ncbi:hypothetical protein NEFER03_0490 [Nematocida sp. LUAm3]|nr:hypothetical protein NEFER03_0490 [Nematocida sp. LUAm3]KAI5175947.1 hypothetical protein NEFER02_1807 [Nematocida sp. LUAm2]KAI5178671.1 hypothetical protein NEFER01_1790 [Nematocida sp. LUAm1]
MQWFGAKQVAVCFLLALACMGSEEVLTRCQWIDVYKKESRNVHIKCIKNLYDVEYYYLEIKRAIVFSEYFLLSLSEHAPQDVGEEARMVDLIGLFLKCAKKNYIDFTMFNITVNNIWATWLKDFLIEDIKEHLGTLRIMRCNRLFLRIPSASDLKENSEFIGYLITHIIDFKYLVVLEGSEIESKQEKSRKENLVGFDIEHKILTTALQLANITDEYAYNELFESQKKDMNSSISLMFFEVKRECITEILSFLCKKMVCRLLLSNCSISSKDSELDMPVRWAPISSLYLYGIDNRNMNPLNSFVQNIIPGTTIDVILLDVFNDNNKPVCDDFLLDLQSIRPKRFITTMCIFLHIRMALKQYMESNKKTSFFIYLEELIILNALGDGVDRYYDFVSAKHFLCNSAAYITPNVSSYKSSNIDIRHIPYNELDMKYLGVAVYNDSQISSMSDRHTKGKWIEIYNSSMHRYINTVSLSKKFIRSFHHTYNECIWKKDTKFSQETSSIDEDLPKFMYLTKFTLDFKNPGEYIEKINLYKRKGLSSLHSEVCFELLCLVKKSECALIDIHALLYLLSFLKNITMKRLEITGFNIPNINLLNYKYLLVSSTPFYITPPFTINGEILVFRQTPYNIFLPLLKLIKGDLKKIHIDVKKKSIFKPDLFDVLKTIASKRQLINTEIVIDRDTYIFKDIFTLYKKPYIVSTDYKTDIEIGRLPKGLFTRFIRPFSNALKRYNNDGIHIGKISMDVFISVVNDINLPVLKALSKSLVITKIKPSQFDKNFKNVLELEKFKGFLKFHNNEILLILDFQNENITCGILNKCIEWSALYVPLYKHLSIRNFQVAKENSCDVFEKFILLKSCTQQANRKIDMQSFLIRKMEGRSIKNIHMPLFQIGFLCGMVNLKNIPCITLKNRPLILSMDIVDTFFSCNYNDRTLMHSNLCSLYDMDKKNVYSLSSSVSFNVSPSKYNQRNSMQEPRKTAVSFYETPLSKLLTSAQFDKNLLKACFYCKKYYTQNNLPVLFCCDVVICSANCLYPSILQNRELKCNICGRRITFNHNQISILMAPFVKSPYKHFYVANVLLKSCFSLDNSLHEQLIYFTQHTRNIFSINKNQE